MTKRKVVYPENMGSTLKWQAKHPIQYDVNIDNDTLIHDGSIKLNPELKAKIDERCKEQTAVSLNTSGNLVQTFSDGSNQSVDLANGLSKKVKVATQVPIKGDGTAVNPIGLSYSSQDFKVVGNELRLNNQPIDRITDFSTHTYKLGMHPFVGSSSTTTFGLPENINSELHEQPMRTNPDIDGAYDYNGYYIATPENVQVMLYGIGNTAWTISNDHGINIQGNLNQQAQSQWGLWQKVDNPAISKQVFDNLVQQVARNASAISALEARVQALENYHAIEEITDFNNHPYKLGIHAFKSSIANRHYARYMPVTIRTTANSIVDTEKASTGTKDFDWGGFYIRTPFTLSVFFVVNNCMVLLRENDSDMSVSNFHDNWTKWVAINNQPAGDRIYDR